MKLLPALAALLFCSSAFAASAPDALVVTGPNLEQKTINGLLVTPLGGIQMKLNEALSFGANLTMPGPIGTVTPNTGAFTGLSGSVTATGSTTARTLAAWFADTVNVIARGADPTGVADSAPAFRAAMGSNRKVFIPPGNYRFASTVSPGCCALDNAAVRVSGFTNFAIEGYGATITVDPAIALSTAIQFDSDTHFRVAGLTIIGDRTGLSSGQENVGIALLSNVDFRLEDLHFPSGFHGNGAPLAGDWLVDGAIDHVEMAAAGHCADFAFLKNVLISDWRATGAGGGATPSGIGQTCISIINDIPNAAQNLTGVSYTQTDGVQIEYVTETNFSAGALISSGVNYLLHGNRWSSNPGVGGSDGIGVLIAYTNGGSSSSVGFPPSNIKIDNDTMDNNGAVTSGAGLLIGQAAITNSDVIANVNVTNTTFDNNTNLGYYADGTTHLSNFTVSNNSYTGAAQTIGFAPAIAAFAIKAGSFSTLSTTGAITVANNAGIYMLDVSGNPQPIFSLSPTNVTFGRPGSAAASFQVQNFAGTPQITVQGGTGGGITLNNHIISTATAPPTVTSCGTSPSISAQSTDHSGTITTGTGAPTLCTLNFNISYASSPKCWVSAGSGSTPIAAFLGARNGSSIVVAFASGLTSGTVDYGCEQ